MTGFNYKTSSWYKNVCVKYVRLTKCISSMISYKLVVMHILWEKQVTRVNNFLSLYTPNFLFICIYFENTSIFKDWLYIFRIITIK